MYDLHLQMLPSCVDLKTVLRGTNNSTFVLLKCTHETFSVKTMVNQHMYTNVKSISVVVKDISQQ